MPILSSLIALAASQAFAHGPGGIHAEKSATKAAFDLVHTRVFKDGTHLVFEQVVAGTAGAEKPVSNGGKFPTAEVLSYVWPTTLDSSVTFPLPESTFFSSLHPRLIFIPYISQCFNS